MLTDQTTPPAAEPGPVDLNNPWRQLVDRAMAIATPDTSDAIFDVLTEAYKLGILKGIDRATPPAPAPAGTPGDRDAAARAAEAALLSTTSGGWITRAGTTIEGPAQVIADVAVAAAVGVVKASREAELVGARAEADNSFHMFDQLLAWHDVQLAAAERRGAGKAARAIEERLAAFKSRLPAGPAEIEITDRLAIAIFSECIQIAGGSVQAPPGEPVAHLQFAADKPLSDEEYEARAADLAECRGRSEIVWQYGFADPDEPGGVSPLDGTPRAITAKMHRRPLRVAGEWGPAPVTLGGTDESRRRLAVHYGEESPARTTGEPVPGGLEGADESLDAR